MLKNSMSRYKRQTSHVLPERINFNHKNTDIVLTYYRETQRALLKRNTGIIEEASEGISPLVLCYFMLSVFV